MILELFCGPGGFAEGAALLGLPTVGIDLDADACRTHRAAGHPTVRADIASLPPTSFRGRVAGLVAGPPCQTFSLAGRGTGRRAMAGLLAGIRASLAGEDVRERVRTEVYPTALADRQLRTKPEDVEQAARADARQATLVLEPARWINAVEPEWVVCEQVEPVLPIWQEYARLLRTAGWSAVAGVLSAERYGVPQTRRRAFLLASRTRRVTLPEPTHQRYVSGVSPAARQPDLFGPGLLPWVSMAEALGWMSNDAWEGPARTVRGRRGPRWWYPQGTGSYRTGRTLRTEQNGHRPAGRVPIERADDEPAPTVVAYADRWEVVHTGWRWQPDGTHQTFQPDAQPAAPVTGQSRVWMLATRRDGPGWVSEHGERADRNSGQPAPTVTAEAHRWRLRNNTRSSGGYGLRSATRSQDEPAGTLFFGHRLNDVSWVAEDAEPARNVLIGPWRDVVRDSDAPAPTIAFGHSSVLWSAEGDMTEAANGRTGSRTAKRMTIAEAAVLQSFRPDYPWQGTRTSVFGQVGNACPPLLAAAVLGAVTGLPWRETLWGGERSLADSATSDLLATLDVRGGRRCAAAPSGRAAPDSDLRADRGSRRTPGCDQTGR